MATLPKQSEWRDFFAETTVYDHLGMAFLQQAPIFAAFGLPQAEMSGNLRWNWSDGGSASDVHPDTHVGSGTYTQVDDSFVSSFALHTAPAQSTIKAGLEKNGNAAFERSSQGAMSAIYDRWVGQLFDGSNSSNQLWGLESFHTSAASTPVGTDTTIDGAEADVLKNIDAAVAEIPVGSDNIIITTTTAYLMVKEALRDSGGNTGVHLGLQHLGFTVPTYEGIPILHTRNLTADGDGDHPMWVINLGPNGVQLMSPEDGPMIDVWGPERVPGKLAWEYDIVMATQLGYASPLAAALINITPTSSS